jgi:hypothetical protein
VWWCGGCGVVFSRFSFSCFLVFSLPYRSQIHHRRGWNAYFVEFGVGGVDMAAPEVGEKYGKQRLRPPSGRAAIYI